MNIPSWIKESCFYQIFPDRFHRNNEAIKLSNLEPWDSEPTSYGFKGGDLLGICEKIDYLLNLGINAIYLNPIFASTANHRYHTYDYFQVDPILGGNKAFKTLVDTCHKKNIKLVIDGVFNHASRGFYQFNHTLENGIHSPYLDWFHFDLTRLKENKPLNPYKEGKVENARADYGYDCWWDLPALPKFNTKTKAVRDYIFSVAKFWIDLGADGWRLDVPYEIDDDSFWQEFRQVVKKANPNAYIVGEIWDNATRWLQGDQFDAVMNYHLGRPIITYFLEDSLNEEALKNSNYETSLIRKLNTEDFSKRVLEASSLYHNDIRDAQMNLLTSHDTARILSMASNNIQNVKLAFAFMFFCPGAPCFYYGDEIGIDGYQDPYCRKTFNWNTTSWNHELLNFFKDLIKIRKKYKVLHSGNITCLKSTGDLSLWAREANGDSFVFAFNRGNSCAQIQLAYKNRNIKFDLKEKSFSWEFLHK